MGFFPFLLAMGQSPSSSLHLGLGSEVSGLEFPEGSGLRDFGSPGGGTEEGQGEGPFAWDWYLFPCPRSVNIPRTY